MQTDRLNHYVLILGWSQYLEIILAFSYQLEVDINLSTLFCTCKVCVRPGVSLMDVVDYSALLDLQTLSDV